MEPLLSPLILALALRGLPIAPEVRREPESARPRVGMTAAEVIERFGPPRRVARQILYKRCLEQWIYEGPHPCRVELDWMQGKQSRVVTVHPITSAGP